MSATGRSNTGETGEEFYPTPETAILPILETPLLVLPGGTWIEPCAGSGAIVRTVARKRSDVRWILSVADADELRIVRDRALASGTQYGGITVGEILESSSETSCLIGDAEGNWFELTTKGAKDYQAIFNGFSV